MRICRPFQNFGKLSLTLIIFSTVFFARLPDDLRDADEIVYRAKRAGVDHGYRCEKNEFDRNQWCLCRPGQKLGSMKSKHDNHKEDREWELKCEDIPGFTPTYTEDNLPFKTTIENAWDAKIEWDGRLDVALTPFL